MVKNYFPANVAISIISSIRMSFSSHIYLVLVIMYENLVLSVAYLWLSCKLIAIILLKLLVIVCRLYHLYLLTVSSICNLCIGRYYRMFEATQDELGRNFPIHNIHGSLLAVGELLRFLK